MKNTPEVQKKIRWYGKTFTIGDHVAISDENGNPTGESGTIIRIDEASNQARIDAWDDISKPELRIKWVGPERMQHVSQK